MCIMYDVFIFSNFKIDPPFLSNNHDISLSALLLILVNKVHGGLRAVKLQLLAARSQFVGHLAPHLSGVAAVWKI